jgi:hypothetical protein
MHILYFLEMLKKKTASIHWPMHKYICQYILNTKRVSERAPREEIDKLTTYWDRHTIADI